MKETGAGGYFPIRWKLIAYFIVFMLLTVLIGLYVNLGLKLSTRFFGEILDEYNYLEMLGEKVYAVRFYTENYLADDSSANLEKCLAAAADLRDRTENIAVYLSLSEHAAKYHSYLDLARSLARYGDLFEKTVAARRTGRLETTYANNYQLLASADLIAKYLANLINRTAVWGNERFSRLNAQTRRIEYLSYALAVVIGLLSIVFCLNFAFGITRPLGQMVQMAEKIGAGNFLVREVAVQSGDELQTIAGVFNRMSRNIHDLFEETQQKALLEGELKEAKMRKLEVENRLREAEIQVLQSQVNPHFLYNTLNAIAQVAILEEAGETGVLIKAVARLLRYNLRSLDQPVTVSAELEHIREYIYIMSVRYGERVDCQVHFPDTVGRYLIPCMTLQPILENAYIHGVAPLNGRRGIIRIALTQTDQRLRIEIADNGVGMTAERLAAARSEEAPRPAGNRKPQAQRSGLGLANVRKRLELFYREKNLLTITSQPGQGTRVVLDLPAREEAARDVSSDDRR
ncbi:histidine kinase/DNA gyrase B/HSP90-like ATPase [Hydrogenispora ethanolica]|uniref:histidine kinase n=1 Tax=Hydrogenispora ethanolica TaxID=1082276 RepID=A0A4R1QPD4_HYDET|nr:histidine kinase [Hydrogenispora ethanolica]TCL54753.1 histidine kinase/DNA gyrase B/HSP90-like ATPase [Hydrogenispora ethanolica]